jgi:hypothetical protein
MTTERATRFLLIDDLYDIRQQLLAAQRDITRLTHERDQLKAELLAARTAAAMKRYEGL